MATCTGVLNESTLDVLRGAALTEEQARAIFALGEEAVIFALLVLTKELAEQRAAAAGTSHQTPATPSHDEAALRKAASQIAQETSRGPKGASWLATQSSRANRPASGTQAAAVPELRWPIEADRRYPHPLYGRRPGHPTGSYRTHDPSRLVPKVQEAGRAGCARRLAEGYFGQSCAGAFGLASLRLGQHALADCRGVQFPSANEDHTRRPGRDVVSVAGDPNKKPCDRPCFTATKAAGASTEKRTGCGASQRPL
jgi:hypothetical protein